MLFLILTLFVGASIYLVLQNFWFLKLKFLLPNFTSSPQVIQQSPVSIVIAAKNEANQLKKKLGAILQQQKITTEVIVIDDHSTDETFQVLQEFQKKYTHLRIYQLQDFTTKSSKKIALTKAIELAKYEVLLFTDADCQPVSQLWAYHMLQTLHLHSKNQIVLGFGGFKKKPNFLNRLQNFETLQTAIQYFSASLWNIPYMGVGRNLMYKKSVFLENQGFEKHLDLKSGDDDLFIQDVANSYNTQVGLHLDSFTISSHASSWKSWFRQKRRHVTTANKYSIWHKLLLGFSFLMKFVFWIGFLVLLFTSFWTTSLFMFSVVMTTEILIQKSIFKHFNEERLILGYPIYNFCLVMFQFCIFSINLFSTPKHWS
ncbi:MAG: glycosyltransferase [Flavobacteriaceae bacterium]|nr:glycosyltransferase [Flavobacteriaceae bacterium]